MHPSLNTTRPTRGRLNPKTVLCSLVNVEGGISRNIKICHSRYRGDGEMSSYARNGVVIPLFAFHFTSRPLFYCVEIAATSALTRSLQPNYTLQHHPSYRQGV